LNTSTMPEEKVIIIGAGPAGIACALQLKRYDIDSLLIEKNEIGGLVKNAWRLDNYPGFPDGISGLELVKKLSEHIRRFDIRYSISDIRTSNHFGGYFQIAGDGKEFSCEFLVIATGTKAKHPQGDQIYTEVYPLLEVTGKKIDIVGAGDAAFDYAMSLSVHNKITIHNRGTNIKCIPALLDMALEHPNISYVENSSPSFSSDYTIFATGREPDLDCLSDELRKKQKHLEQEGLLYVIGDVKNGMVRQTSVATGDGIRAAMAIKDRLKSG